jgi:hypothetical protein
MRNLKPVLFAGLCVVLAACGAAEKKPANTADAIPTSGDATAEDMPAPPSEKSGEVTPATDATKTAEAPQAGGVIKIAPMKLVPAKKGKNDKAVELASDGTITADGQAVAKIAGDQVDAVDGRGTLLTIGLDGSLVGQSVKKGFKFSGDELANEAGVKVVIGDDGAINYTDAKGKTDVLGKLEGGEKAKRAAALVAVLMLVSDPQDRPQPAPTTASPAATKPAKK